MKKLLSVAYKTNHTYGNFLKNDFIYIKNRRIFTEMNILEIITIRSFVREKIEDDYLYLERNNPNG